MQRWLSITPHPTPGYLQQCEELQQFEDVSKQLLLLAGGLAGAAAAAAAAAAAVVAAAGGSLVLLCQACFQLLLERTLQGEPVNADGAICTQ